MSNYYTLRIKKICFSPNVPIQPCRPKSDSASCGAIRAPFNSPVESLYQSVLGLISALGSKSALGNGTVYWPLIKGATSLESKIGLYFTH